jgi:hypothetical protein
VLREAIIRFPRTNQHILHQCKLAMISVPISSLALPTR